MTFYCIIGLGISGLATAKYCLREGIPFGVTDSREEPPGLAELKALEANVELALGGFSVEMIKRATHLIVSPGVSLKEPLIQSAVKAGKVVTGDIELFARVAKKPVIAVTGSNGKTTVTTLLGDMAKASGKRAVVAGNIGQSVLDSLSEKILPDVYILELSSFQLERTQNLPLKAAAFLNLCEDHMDRYDSLAEYQAAKQNIYRHAECAVFNRDDEYTIPPTTIKYQVSFGLSPSKTDYTVITLLKESYLAKAEDALMPKRKLFLEGNHHVLNALAALAVGEIAGFDREAMLDVLKKFRGIPHRCQLLRTMQGVSWYNDSKGTNVGATIAAIKTIAEKTNGRLILIAGGVGKGADFSPLKPLLKKYTRAVVLIGESAKQMQRIFSSVTEVHHAKSMHAAVQAAEMLAVRGDSVLLSPACASFDMFDNYEHRGDVFTNCVKTL